MDWQLQKQERKGDYWFNGKFYATKGVNEDVPLPELLAMLGVLQNEAREQNGIDYLRVFIHVGTGKKIWFIDQLTHAQVKEYPPEEHYCTALWPEEY